MTRPDDYLITLASYFWPDADDCLSRRMLRLGAVFEMRAIARRSRLAASRHVCPASGTHDGEPFVPQELEGLARGVGRYVVDPGEVAGGGESLSGGVLSAGDPSSQVIGGLYVGRG